MNEPHKMWLLFLSLRADAQKRGMVDLAVVYGQSAMIYGAVLIGQKLRANRAS